MPYRPVFIMNSGERANNSLVFETEDEAFASAMDKFQVWTGPSDFTTEVCEGPVNYVWVNGLNQRVEKG